MLQSCLTRWQRAQQSTQQINSILTRRFAVSSAKPLIRQRQQRLSVSKTQLFRRRFDRVPPNYLVYGLLGANAAVFLGWQYAEGIGQRFKDSKPLLFLYKNFCLSESNLFSGRVWTLVTSCFSHAATDRLPIFFAQNKLIFADFFINMLGLYFLAPAVASILGNTSFMSLYLLSGVTSGLGFLALDRIFSPPIQKDRYGREVPRQSYLSGASGSSYGILSFFAMANPQARFLLFFIVPVPAWALVPGLFCWDLYRTINRSTQSRVASSAHVCGLLTGVAYYMMRYRRPLRRL